MEKERECRLNIRSYKGKEVSLVDERRGEIEETTARWCSTCPADGEASEGDLLPYAPDVRGNPLVIAR